ncbi:hypothetical protein PHYBOEH_001386 [Phytophthora boehmeriae]|uniref:PH domain-containing protein n=1 Tax=Phytophthora boehmeriae TaxID=109152 RepID=A0A8T1X7S0_9STRA|nr:hypothetical protein PHYBOEH_001386 [Phytophthora boehmeriae]
MQALQDAQQRFNDLVNNDWPERVPVESMPDYDPSFMKEGFLQKKGQRLKGWKRRWFVCDGRTLSYYISRKDRKPNAVIPLEGCTVQDGGLSETWNSPRIYLTDPATGIMYCLSAEEGIVVTQWLDVLRTAVARVNNGTTSTSDSGSAPSSQNNRSRHHTTIGGVASSIDYSSITTPRDLLLLRHVRESAAPDQQDCNDDNSVDEMGQSVVLILEKSVANELKPIFPGTVRAHVGLSGWLLEPVDAGHATLATYVTDIDMKGWLSPATRESFLLSRLDGVSVLSEYVNQARLCGSELGFGGGVLDEDGDGDYETRSVGYEDTSEGSLGEVADGSSSAIFHPKTYMRGMLPLPSGGLKLIDKEVAKKQGGVVKDVIKSAGAKILEGKSAVSLSLPVRIFEPRTNLERICDLMLYAPTFLNVAYEQSDPLERFKYVITNAVAGLHHSIGQLKPFNPILGETFQSTLNDGTDVSCEHTSHHPPISNFQFTGEKYSIAGFVVWAASMSVKSNAMLNTNKGPVRASFPESEALPATTIEYNLPYLQIGGLLWGDRTVDIMGSMVFEDKRNHLQCELRLNPDEKKGMGGMFSSSKTPTDSLRGVIIDTSATPPREICDVSGSWLHDLVFGDKTYWSINKHQSGYMVPYPENKILASDSRYREDLRYLAAGDMDEAQEWKVKLEVLQRADRKARLDGRRPNHWSFQESASGH